LENSSSPSSRNQWAGKFSNGASTNLFFLLGCVFYVAASGLWIYLLGQFDYSRIYPMFIGTCIILLLIAGILFFRENTGIMYKLIGSMFILGGVIIITRA
jgi:multidrug transporter EmrE-like cation transporter